MIPDAKDVPVFRGLLIAIPAGAALWAATIALIAWSLA